MFVFMMLVYHGLFSLSGRPLAGRRSVDRRWSAARTWRRRKSRCYGRRVIEGAVSERLACAKPLARRETRVENERGSKTILARIIHQGCDAVRDPPATAAMVGGLSLASAEKVSS